MHDDDFTVDLSGLTTVSSVDLDTSNAADFTIGDISINTDTFDGSVYTGSGWQTITTGTTTTPYIWSDNVTFDEPTMKVDGDLVVNGRNVLEELDVIKTLLDGAVIQRDLAMEDEFQKLKALADEYQKQLEKYKTFKALKDSK